MFIAVRLSGCAAVRPSGCRAARLGAVAAAGFVFYIRLWLTFGFGV
jgi:hypothetical protein